MGMIEDGYETFKKLPKAGKIAVIGVTVGVVVLAFIIQRQKAAAAAAKAGETSADGQVTTGPYNLDPSSLWGNNGGVFGGPGVTSGGSSSTGSSSSGSSSTGSSSSGSSSTGSSSSGSKSTGSSSSGSSSTGSSSSGSSSTGTISTPKNTVPPKPAPKNTAGMSNNFWVYSANGNETVADAIKRYGQGHNFAWFQNYRNNSAIFAAAGINASNYTSKILPKGFQFSL